MAGTFSNVRMLMVTPNYPPQLGGTQTYSFELARQFNAVCGDFLVFAPQVRGSQEFDAQHEVPIIRHKDPGDNFALSGRLPLHKIFLNREFEIVMCTHWSAAFAASQAMRKYKGSRPKPKLACAAHGKELLIRPLRRLPFLQGIYDKIRRSAFENTDHIFPVSGFTGRLLRDCGVETSKIAVVNNGVDPNYFYPSPSQTTLSNDNLQTGNVILTVARLVPRKGIDLTLSVLGLVRQEIPDVRYVIVGDGPDRHRLKKLAEKYGVSDSVQFIGYCSSVELRTHYQDCDLFLLPASSKCPDVEGFGLSILEASACGKPVLGSTEGGIPDAILDGTTGLTVDLANPTALAEAAIRILKNPTLARKFGRAGRTHTSTKANWSSTAHQILQAISASSPD